MVDADCDALHVLPLSLLYCHVAPASMPLMLTLVSLVMLSVLLLPVSVVKANPGADGSVVSIVQLLVLLPVLADTLPATSVCRTFTAPLA